MGAQVERDALPHGEKLPGTLHLALDYLVTDLRPVDVLVTSYNGGARREGGQGKGETVPRQGQAEEQLDRRGIRQRHGFPGAGAPDYTP